MASPENAKLVELLRANKPTSAPLEVMRAQVGKMRQNFIDVNARAKVRPDTKREAVDAAGVPAEWFTPAGVREVVIPAETRTVKKKVMVEPPKTVKKTIPAKYRTVKYQKLITPAKHVREVIPAKMETVTKTKRVGEGKMEWRSVLCETNAGSVVLTDIQKALKKAGFNPGTIDGVLGRDTMDALTKFQESKNLPAGKLTMETLEALGVRN